jgi:predicted phage terminase large subunit-like protein
MRPAPHHVEMMEWIMERLERRENGVALLPRGHAKTTWFNSIMLSWLESRHPNLRVGLISNTAKQANAFSRAVRFTLEANEYQHDIFGNLAGKHKWNDVEWIQKDSALLGTKDVNMYSAGAGGAIISKRFDLILCDDILDEENSVNPEQREKVENWFWKTLKPCLVPGGSIIVIGTRWAEGDLYQSLIEDKKWPHIVRGAIHYPCGACKQDFANPDAYDAHSCATKGVKPKPAALWPEMWPLDKLELEKRDMGSAMFACSYLNDISGLMAGNIFRREWFADKYFTELPNNPAGYTWTMGIDLASSEKQRADYTARVVVAKDDDNNSFVFSVNRAKIETGHREFVMDGALANPLISKIIVENNQFQGAFVKDLINSTNLPIVGKKAEVDKVTRARSVAARYESGKVYHHKSLEGSDFEIELLQFPKGHDDMIDALGYAMETGVGGAYFGSFQTRRF